MKPVLSIFRIANVLYKRCFPVYNPLYFLYKTMTDRKVIGLLREHIRPGMHVVDIGGNIGFYTVIFSRLVGEGGKVSVFEPDVVNFGHLMKKTKGLRNVAQKHAAVAERSGTIRLYRSDELNVDHQTYDAGEGRSFVEVTCVALDDYFSDGGNVDFIKMDVQGYEYYALLGMKELIGRSGPLTLFTEFWPYGLCRAGVDPNNFLRLLNELGFEITFRESSAETDWIAAANDKSFYCNLCAAKG